MLPAVNVISITAGAQHADVMSSLNSATSHVRATSFVLSLQKLFARHGCPLHNATKNSPLRHPIADNHEREQTRTASMTPSRIQQRSESRITHPQRTSASQNLELVSVLSLNPLVNPHARRPRRRPRTVHGPPHTQERGVREVITARDPGPRSRAYSKTNTSDDAPW